MIRKEITFDNFLDEKETDVFYFNMSKGELVKMQMAAIDEKTESFQDKLEKIGKAINGKELIDIVDEIVLNGYGEKSTDGKHFVKERNGIKLSERFKASGAYSELIVELCTNSEAMAEFVNGLMPANLRDEVAKEVNASQAARERSAASLTGYQKKQEKQPGAVVQEPELPTVIEGTADPILEGDPKPDFSKMTEEELRNHFANQ